MYRNLYIGSYRGLQNVKLMELSHINIIIGDNNSGKTSILEAIQLLDHGDVLSNTISTARRRESQFVLSGRNKLWPFDMFLYSFAMQEEYGMKEIWVEADNEETGRCCAEIRGSLKKELFFPDECSRKEQRRYEVCCDENGYIRVMVGDYHYENGFREDGKFFFNELQDTPVLQDERSNRNEFRRRMERRMTYISPMDIYTNKIISASLYKGMLTEEKKRLLELLRLFDDRIRGIEMGVQYGYPVTLIEMEDCGLVPISVFGDGLKKILALASAIVRMRGGVVLIDEFETGIHKHALIKVAQWMAMVTKRYHVQIFLTTHSSDAIDALIKAQLNYDDMNAYRLEHYKNQIYVKKFRGTELEQLRREQGMDIL